MTTQIGLLHLMRQNSGRRPTFRSCMHLCVLAVGTNAFDYLHMFWP